MGLLLPGFGSNLLEQLDAVRGRRGRVVLEQGSGTGDQALRAAAESGATVMSFCSGAFALAQAGLGSAAKLRARMADHVGVTPSTHRRRFSRAS